MRVGISIGTFFAPGESSGAARSVLIQAEAAARAGLDTLTVGDHHATGPNVYLQNVPLIGRMLGVWDQRPVGCLFLVPLWHPVLMAARLGTSWYGNADLTARTAAAAMDLYREACARHDRHPARLPIRKDVHIAEDRAEAARVGDALTAAGYRGFERGAVAYGDPASVAEQLAPFAELGFTDVIVRTMTQDDSAVRTIELAAELSGLLP